jgi:hypothetical protein
MKRIIVWVDTENKKVGQTIENIKRFLSSAGLEYNIVDVCEIGELGDSK